MSCDKNSTDLSTPLDQHITMALGHPRRSPGVIFPSHHILHTKLTRDPEVEVGCQLSCVRQYRLGVNVEVDTPCRGGTVSETETQAISAHTTADTQHPDTKAASTYSS